MTLVMEYIGGGSLDDYITKNNGLKEDEAIKIVKQIGSALSFMHKNKMLHLDLKPSNIMRKESGDVVLIDFGLSKQYDSKGEPESSTKVGAGTPGYAPIEQANYREGKGFPVTMDVYALGGTMFKMLTGVRPPEASDILNDGFPLYELQEHGISERISASIAKAMAPIKKDRYQTVADFLDSFEEEATIIDVDISFRKGKNLPVRNENKKDDEKVVRSENAKKFLQITPDTSKVRIEYWPYSLFPPRYNGAFIATVTPYEVNPNVSQESTREMIPMTSSKYKKFLNALQALKLEIREEAVEQFEPGSFSPAKLKISLYDNDGFIYNDLWIDGMNGGNIVGNVDAIEKQIIQIVPGLSRYLNGPFYEIPDLIKEQKIKIKSSRSEITKPIRQELNMENSNISYRWWSILVLIIEVVFAWFMLTQSRESDLDSDGRILSGLYFFASLVCVYYLFSVRKKISLSKWKTVTVISTILCLANSCMLPIWNGSLTGAYFLLSIGLSIVSSFTFLIKKSA